MLRNKDMSSAIFPSDINKRTAFFSISCHGFVHIVCCCRFVRTPKMLPFDSFANILPLFCNIVYTLNARQRLNINTTPSCFIGIYATLTVVFPFSIPSGDEIRIYRLQILFAGVLSFDPLGADHFCLAGIPVFPCNPVLRSPFEAMAEIPERLLYLRGIGPPHGLPVPYRPSTDRFGWMLYQTPPGEVSRILRPPGYRYRPALRLAPSSLRL